MILMKLILVIVLISSCSVVKGTLGLSMAGNVCSKADMMVDVRAGARAEKENSVGGRSANVPAAVAGEGITRKPHLPKPHHG